jgi:hypothetical protein
LNPGLIACEATTLPLSYIPKQQKLSEKAFIYLLTTPKEICLDHQWINDLRLDHGISLQHMDRELTIIEVF